MFANVIYRQFRLETQDREKCPASLSNIEFGATWKIVITDGDVKGFNER